MALAKTWCETDVEARNVCSNPALGSSLSSCEVRHGVRCQRCKVTAFVLQRTKKPGQLGPRCFWQL